MVKLKMNILIAVCCLVCITRVTARDGFPPMISVPQGNKWSNTLVFVRKASPTEFRCEAKADPPATYYWTVNGTVISPDERTVSFNKETGTLTTGSLFGQINTGDYQCFATNKLGTAMTPILKITATVANPFKGYGVSTTDEYVYVYKYLMLECKDVPLSVPQWQFSWQKGQFNKEGKLDTTLVGPSERLLIDKKGNLHFLWSEKSDNGFIYVCSTKNNILLIEVSNSQTIRLTVNDGTVRDRDPQLEYSEDVEVLAGDDAELMCIFSYYSMAGEKMKINWLRRGEKVGEGYKLKLDNVLLPDETHNQEGGYICEALLGDTKSIKGIRKAYGIVNLKIVAPPRFIKYPESKSVLVGNDAVFHCETKSHNSHSDPVVWFMNAVPIIGCQDRRFECSAPDSFTSYSQCLREKLVCNNYPDCDDKSDEAFCPGSCSAGQVWCKDRCQSKECTRDKCEYPGFLCKDKKTCLTLEQVCNKVEDCNDGSDESGCPGGAMITRERWKISSDRTKLVLPNVTRDDKLCVQCLVRNEYGSTIGDACLTVIDKIVVLRGPNATYDVEPGMFVFINVEATTDRLFQNKMNFKWLWYEERPDKKSGITEIKPVLLPPKSDLGNYIHISQNGKNFVIMFPLVNDETPYNAYYAMKDRLYTLIIEHRYDKVEVNFTINGINISNPVPNPLTFTYKLNRDAESCRCKPCKNNGTCTNLLDGYTCTCTAGWTGTHCDQSTLKENSVPIVGGVLSTLCFVLMVALIAVSYLLKRRYRNAKSNESNSNEYVSPGPPSRLSDPHRYSIIALDTQTEQNDDLYESEI